MYNSIKNHPQRGLYTQLKAEAELYADTHDKKHNKPLIYQIRSLCARGIYTEGRTPGSTEAEADHWWLRLCSWTGLY